MTTHSSHDKASSSLEHASQFWFSTYRPCYKLWNILENDFKLTSALTDLCLLIGIPIDEKRGSLYVLYVAHRINCHGEWGN